MHTDVRFNSIFAQLTPACRSTSAAPDDTGPRARSGGLGLLALIASICLLAGSGCGGGGSSDASAVVPVVVTPVVPVPVAVAPTITTQIPTPSERMIEVHHTLPGPDAPHRLMNSCGALVTMRPSWPNECPPLGPRPSRDARSKMAIAGTDTTASEAALAAATIARCRWFDTRNEVNSDRRGAEPTNGDPVRLVATVATTRPNTSD